MTTAKPGNKAKKDGSRLVFYIGDDLHYWQMVAKRMEDDYPSAGYQCEQLFHKAEKEHQKLFIEILERKPCVIYIDFSIRLEEHLILAQLIKRDNSTMHIPVVGLVEKQEYLFQSLTAGVDFTHVKCAEYDDVVYDPLKLVFPKEVKNKDFAKAKVKQDFSLIHDFRIGFITATYIHCEGNLKLKQGEEVTIDHNLPKNLVPSRRFIVKAIQTNNLYYDYKYAYDLQILFLDEPMFSNEDDKLMVDNETNPDRKKALIEAIANNRKEKQREYEERLAELKLKFSDWVMDNIDMSSPKKTKVMIVDKSMKVLRDEVKPIDQYPYNIRCQTFLSDDLKEIEHSRPNIIAFNNMGQYIELKEKIEEAKIVAAFNPEGRSVDELAKIKNAQEYLKAYEQEKRLCDAFLGQLTKKIKQTENYAPILVIFNSHRSSKAMQESYQYNLVVGYTEPMNFKIVLELAEKYEKNQQKKYDEKVKLKIIELRKSNPDKFRHLTEHSFRDKCYYVKKTSELSFASYSYSVVIDNITESEMYFSTPELLDLNSFRLNYPVAMSVKLIPIDGKAYKEAGKEKQYHSLIHSIDEDNKKRLRQFINEMFTQHIVERERIEKQNFDKLNKTKKSELITQGVLNSEDSSQSSELASEAGPSEEAQTAEQLSELLDASKSEMPKSKKAAS